MSEKRHPAHPIHPIVSFLYGVDHQSTAILFFSRSAEKEGHHKKWLAARPMANRQIAQRLIELTINELGQTGLPIFHVDESKQTGHTFGQRLANAFAGIFALGYQSVISVGNDAPGLSGVNWRRIQGELSSGRNVIGPDYRHGAYLIGLTRTSFDPARLENLPWQTPNLLDRLLAYCQDPHLLEKKRDVNSCTDLKMVSRTSPILKKLLLLIFGPVYRSIEPDLLHSLLLSRSLSLRAPPFL